MAPTLIAESPRLGAVTLVHDYLNQRGGAERVALEMSAIWPEAPLYTTIYRPESTFSDFRACDVRTSFLDRLPVDAHFRALLPLYPAAFAAFGDIEADVVISSSSGWAHSVRSAPGAFHVVYCHAPARWLYRTDQYLPGKASRAALAPVLAPLRRWDRRAARRADLYIANTYGVRRRIRLAYGIDAAVVHPPVDIDRFTPRARGERLLVVSRLLPYKRIDLVVEAANRLGLGLDIVGDGPDLSHLQSLAGPLVEFHGRLPDQAVTGMMENCRSFCVPGDEDFGIAAIEANAAGKPVVAYQSGGALETMRDGFTAALFEEPTVKDVEDAICRADSLTTSPELLRSHAERFSSSAFRHQLVRAVVAGLERRRG